MVVFVLCTGRTGSKTFMEACRHITNYSTGHETRCQQLGAERVNYPDKHIEVDNRLSWFLGRLQKKYGDQAFYVHLKRDREKVAQSFNKRWFNPHSIIRTYTNGILMVRDRHIKYCYDYIDTVNENIEFFLENKTNRLVFNLENGREDFKKFWELIDAEGDLDKALKEWETVHNPSNKKSNWFIKLQTVYLNIKYSIYKRWK